ncbi:MAG: guanylate cyclase [Rhodospirillales bacterium]|nr:guanylate cyclase [Rhodospirillales bacterium]
MADGDLGHHGGIDLRLHGKRPKIADLQSQLRHFDILLNVSRRVSGTESLDEILDALVETTSRAIGADRSSFFLFDPNTDELFSRSAQGIHRREIRFSSSEGVGGAVFQSREPMIVDDAYSDPRFNADVDKETGYTTKTILCVPIRTVKDEVIGVAQCLNKHSGAFTEKDASLLSDIAQMAVPALRSSQFVERMRKVRAQEMEFLSVVADITSELELDSLLARVMAEATRMLDAERSTLFLHDEKTDTLFSRVAQGSKVGEIRLPSHAGIAGTVFTTNKTVNIPHAYADLRFNPGFDKTTGFFTRSILCTPVVNKYGKVIGVTQALNKKGGPFSEDDESRLKAFTAQVAIALENAKLFDDVQKMKNYNESMLLSMSNGVVTLSESRVVVTCNEAGLKIFQCKAADIIGKKASDFFVGKNEWIVERIAKVETQKTSDIQMDVALDVGGTTATVNFSVLPLKTDHAEQLGTMLMIEDISTEKRVKATMSRYMDPTIAARMLENDDGGMLGGQNTRATVMFSDIRGFTPITEQLGAQGTVSFLNEYFTIMVEAISKEEGMLDKFIGDAIMAAFGLPMPHDDDEDRAVRASIAMIRECWKYSAERVAKGFVPVDMGIGLNTDMVVSGNIGSARRMDYTLIGDGVNLASRLESACKAYSARILISENTYKRLRGTYRVRDIDMVIVKGKTEPVGVYEVLDYHTDETFPNLMDVVNYFNEGIRIYRKREFGRAIENFQEALERHPKDRLSQTYIDRCKYMIEHPPADDWIGVWQMKEK